jgi:hypothetical protein
MEVSLVPDAVQRERHTSAFTRVFDALWRETVRR